MTAEGDRMRRARLEFEEAMERGCTIPELRAAKTRELKHRAEAYLDTLRQCGRRAPDVRPERPEQPRSPFLQADEPRHEPWMMRD